MSESLVIILSSQANQSCYDSIRLNGEVVQVIPINDFNDFSDNEIPNLVLLDCGQDVINGLGLLRDIKVFHPHVPVIFITEVTSENIAVEAFRCGARDYLKKPFNVPELQRSMECILHINETPREQRRSCLMNIYYHDADRDNELKVSLPPNMYNVVQYIDKNLSSSHSLDELAKIARASKYYFCKIFKKHVGVSPLRYVALKRVNKAKHLLFYSDMNIAEVAWEAGFNDLSNFNKHFKKYTGVTPTSYKHAAKMGETGGE
jgi:YesN/AraC family two-component response regulator